MKNKNKRAKTRSILAIIALVAVIGFSMAACGGGGDDDSGGGGGTGGGGDSGTATNGQLTINGLSAANGKYAYALADLKTDNGNNGYFIASQSLKGGYPKALGLISGGSVTLKVWLVGADYSGNDQNVKFTVRFRDTPEIKDVLDYSSGEADADTINGSATKTKGGAYVTVNFSGGKATGTATNVSVK